jgi:hypothetical protein
MKDPHRCLGTTREQAARKAKLRSSDLAGEHLHLVPKDGSGHPSADRELKIGAMRRGERTA